MTEQQANEIYDVLVAAWAAQEQWRENFVDSLVNQDCREYRCGWGKFYLEPDCWRVGVYVEDQSEQATRIAAVNKVLATLLRHSKQQDAANRRVSYSSALASERGVRLEEIRDVD
jgi:hypothetical protein